MVFEISEFERFNAIEDHIPVGIFEVDRHKRISYSNNTFKKLLQFPEGELENVYARDFFINNVEFKNLIKRIVKEKINIIDEEVKLKSLKGGLLISKIDVFPEFDNNGILIKSKGLIQDIAYSNILQEVPIGLYLVTQNDKNEEVLVKVNKQFAHIKGYSKPSDLEGMSIVSFHSSKETYIDFMKRLDKADSEGQILSDYKLTIKTKTGENKEIIVYSKYIKN